MREDDHESAIPVALLAIAADRARRMTGHCLERVAEAKADRTPGVGGACAVAAPASVTGFAAVHCDADPVEAARVRAEARADLATPGFAAAAESGAITPTVRGLLATGTDDFTREAWLEDVRGRPPAEAVQKLRAAALGEMPEDVPENRATVTDGWVPSAGFGAGAWVFRTPLQFDPLAFDVVSRAIKKIGTQRQATLAPVRAFGAMAEELEKAPWPASPEAIAIGRTFKVDPVEQVAWIESIQNSLQVPLSALPPVPAPDQRWRRDGTEALRLVAQRDDGTPVDLEPGPLLAAFRGLASNSDPPPARRARVRRPPRAWPDWRAPSAGGGAFDGAAAFLARCDFDAARPATQAAWSELLELAASSSRVGHALSRELCHALALAEDQGRLASDEADMAVVDGVRLALSWRDARERIRVARALRRLPWCDWVFARGEACYTKVRAVVAVATPEDDPRWASAMRRCDVATFEAMVARAAAGDISGPPAVRAGERPLWPIGRPVTLRCYDEVAGDAGQALRRVRERLATWAGRPLSSADAVELLCRLYLAVSGESKRHTIVFHHGPETRAASDPRRRLAPRLAAIADPLARVLAAFPHLAGRFAELGVALDDSGTRVVHRPSRTARRRSARDEFERALRAVEASPDPGYVPPLFRRLQAWRDGPRCRVPWCPNYLVVQYHHGVPLRTKKQRARLADDRGVCGVCNDAEGAGFLIIVPLPGGGIRVTDNRGRPLGRRFKPGAHLDVLLRERLLQAAARTVAAATPPVEPATGTARGDP